MSTRTLEDVFIDELRDIYDAEKQIVLSLPRMVKSAHAPALVAALEQHLEQTEEQVARIDRLFEQLGHAPRRRNCKAMASLLAEAEELLAGSSDVNVRDATIIAAGKKIEHYEMATYQTLCDWAMHLGHRDVIAGLQKALEEESAADRMLSSVGSTLHAEAAHSHP